MFLCASILKLWARSAQGFAYSSTRTLLNSTFVLLLLLVSSANDIQVRTTLIMAPHQTIPDLTMRPHSDNPSYGFQASATQFKMEKANAKPGPALMHRSLLHEPETVIHASGLTLTLSSGRTIIDACGGAAVSSLGHGNREVLDAAMQQMQKVSYVHTGAYTTSAAEELASLVLEHGEQYGLEKAFFCSSGSEAMDTALKLARQFFYETGEKQRTNFVARKQSWHGTTIGAMSVGSNLPRKVPYEPLLLQNVSHVTPAYAYQYQHKDESEKEFVTRLATELDAHFQGLHPELVIAFIAEPVVGATSGCVEAPTGYFRAVRDVCDKYGILLILDEVMCGMGRVSLCAQIYRSTSFRLS